MIEGDADALGGTILDHWNYSGQPSVASFDHAVDVANANYRRAEAAEQQRDALLVENAKLNRMRTHCVRCGADYLATGIEAGCPCLLVAERDALLGRLAQVEWKPTDTAPRDGTPFRAYGTSLVHPDFNPWGQVEAVFDGERFIGAVWDGQFDSWNTVPIEFTHWQPLPDSPTGRVRSTPKTQEPT